MEFENPQFSELVVIICERFGCSGADEMIIIRQIASGMINCEGAGTIENADIQLSIAKNAMSALIVYRSLKPNGPSPDPR